MKGNVKLQKNVVLEDSKYVTNMGLYIFIKEFISFDFLLNYFLVHYLKKALVETEKCSNNRTTHFIRAG